MASDPQGAEWIRLSTAVARMCEVASAYRTYVGLARRDLKTAIRAGRVRIRGCSVESLAGPPVEIGGPIISQHELDLIHDTISERRPGPSGPMTLFRSVEVEWAGTARYLRSVQPVSGENRRIVDPPPAAASDRINLQAAKRKRGRHPTKLEAIKDAMRSKIKEGTITRGRLNEMLEKELKAEFGASRSTCREARNAILSESGFVGNSIPDK